MILTKSSGLLMRLDFVTAGIGLLGFTGVCILRYANPESEISGAEFLIHGLSLYVLGYASANLKSDRLARKGLAAETENTKSS
jgi:hypothetical protein